jgi:hypothetical protein
MFRHAVFPCRYPSGPPVSPAIPSTLPACFLFIELSLHETNVWANLGEESADSLIGPGHGSEPVTHHPEVGGATSGQILPDAVPLINS